MSKTYQKNRRLPSLTRSPAEVAVPEQVIVSMAEIAESAKEGLLALAVGTGLQVMTAMFEEDVTALCGPEGRHNADRAGYRHGSEAGSVTLGGRRVPVTRPRVRAADGSGELHLPSAMTCSPPPRSSGRWRWSGCSRACRPAAMSAGWSRPGSRWSRRPRRPRSRRSPAGSWPRPRPHWPS